MSHIVLCLSAVFTAIAAVRHHKRKAEAESSPTSSKSKKHHQDEVDAHAQEKIKELEAELAAQKKIASNAMNAAKSSSDGLVSKASQYHSNVIREYSLHPVPRECAYEASPCEGRFTRKPEQKGPQIPSHRV